jgi:ABC-type phosphate transport system substrate-binding protein
MPPVTTKAFHLSCFYLFALLFFSQTAGAETDADYKQTDTITGAGAHFAWVIFDELKDELEKSTGKKLQLYGKNSNLGMGCNSGIKLAQQHSHEHQTFGFICCPLSEEELAQKKIKIYPIAEEPILILVNKNNPVDNLSTDQVRAIFRGDITNWKDVGGWDKPVAVVTRLHCKKRPGHWKTILPNAKDFTKKRINVTSADEMVSMVTKFDTAIGHTGSTWVFDKGSNVKAISIDNITASAESLRNKSYPFYRKLSAVTSMNPSADVLTTIRQVQYGKSFEAIAKKYNLLPLNTAVTE